MLVLPAACAAAHGGQVVCEEGLIARLVRAPSSDTALYSTGSNVLSLYSSNELTGRPSGGPPVVHTHNSPPSFSRGASAPAATSHSHSFSHSNGGEFPVAVVPMTVRQLTPCREDDDEAVASLVPAPAVLHNDSNSNSNEVNGNMVVVALPVDTQDFSPDSGALLSTTSVVGFGGGGGGGGGKPQLDRTRVNWAASEFEGMTGIWSDVTAVRIGRFKYAGEGVGEDGERHSSGITSRVVWGSGNATWASLGRQGYGRVHARTTSNSGKGVECHYELATNS